MFIVLFSPIASSIEIRSSLDPYEKYYRDFYRDNSYIVYRGMILNISDSLSLQVVLKNESGYDVRVPLVNASFIIDNAFKVVGRQLSVHYRNVSRSDNSTVVRISASFRGSILVEKHAPLNTIHRVGVEWVITRFINTTILDSSIVREKEEKYRHLLGFPLRIILRNITGNYTVGDNLLSWAYPTPLGINITLFNPALGIPGPENETHWGKMIPLRPSMLIVYNVSVNVTIVSGTRFSTTTLLM